ncbi:hemoglobin/transferrin/lactoferrin receptor protein [Tangfeifania diversioriginum]|uniref:Hemoglobin/transferrin/lactoferrin receptor protein n=1 Tax=Tangfeifania diversioriginum TaxID=1168035 RepID=A0A1M6A364_9BACT|nr:TonB-dependent receptor [Tangfeifania diversioriginum]SHI30964.1 hemoglobin/transferrin/lactoferrin receptor protein [Tangfeifania diversioriginum]
MKYLILPVVFFISIFKVSAQTVSVLNARTNEPVEGVLVVAESNYTTQTDEMGGVNLGLIQQEETILFQHASFLNFSATKAQIVENGNVVILVEDPVRLDEVVISVNRWEQSKTEVPHKIETLNAEDVLQISPQTTADLLGTKNGVFIQKSQMGGGSPMIRGFAANRVLLVVDGIRMNNAIFRSGNLHNVISLDANSLESTEIIFGPGSVIYGSDALGGVMSFSTLKPRLSTKKNAEINGKTFMRYSSANFEKTIHGTFNFGSQKWAALVSSTFTDFNDLRMGSNGPTEYLRKEFVAPGKFGGSDEIIPNENELLQKFTGYSQFNLLSKFRYRPGDELDVTFSALHSQTSDIPRYDRLIAYRNDKLRYGNWYYGPQKWTLASGSIKYQKNHLLFDKANLLAGYQNYEESRHDRSLNGENLRHRTENLDVFSLNLDLGKSIDTRNEIFYGAEAFFNKVRSSGFSENLTDTVSEEIAPRYPDNSTYNSFAAYASYKLKFSDKLILQAGARFTQTLLSGDFDAGFYDFPFSEFNMKNSALNGNVGVVWHPTTDWQVNLNVSTGFRSPNIDDVAKVFDSEPGNVIVPNPGLEPEYARNFELGIVRSYAGKARFEITGFYTQLKNAMVRRDFLLNGQDSILYDGTLSNVEALVNAESAQIMGGSFSFRYLFTPFFRTRHNITVVKGEDADGFPLRHVPPAFGSSHLVFEKQKWFVDLYLDYSGAFTFNQLAPSEQDKPHLYTEDENGNPWSPPWWTLNIKSSYQVSDYFSINGGIENIFDKRYRTYSSGIVAPGINFKLSAMLKF